MYRNTFSQQRKAVGVTALYNPSISQWRTSVETPQPLATFARGFEMNDLMTALQGDPALRLNRREALVSSAFAGLRMATVAKCRFDLEVCVVDRHLVRGRKRGSKSDR
jgi:hypothetical protein